MTAHPQHLPGGKKLPLDEQALFWCVADKDATVSPPFIPFPDYVTMDVSIPSGFGGGDHLSKEEVLGLYACTNPVSFLQAFDLVVLRRKGNFPMPGWHTHLIASRFLEYCKQKYQGMFHYDVWFDAICIPRAGIQRGGINQKKALLIDQSVDKNDRPKKKRAIPEMNGEFSREMDVDHDDMYEEMS